MIEVKSSVKWKCIKRRCFSKKFYALVSAFEKEIVEYYATHHCLQFTLWFMKSLCVCWIAQGQLYYSGQKWAFWGWIRWGHLFKKQLWLNSRSHRVPQGTKWKLKILSFQWYPPWVSVGQLVWIPQPCKVEHFQERMHLFHKHQFFFPKKLSFKDW